MNTKILLLITSLVFCFSINSQTKKLTINVVNNKSKPIPGAIILFDNVRQKSWTNSKGIFKIKISEAPKEISAFSPKVGIKKVKYNNEKEITITIDEGNDLTLVGNTNVKNIGTSQYRNIYDYLRGKVPGVLVGTGNTILIRGYNTVNGNSTPLFVINNNAVDQSVFSDIVPSNIVSIRILKGPEAAKYGSRGAHGVIEVIRH
ncbi:TonB-dependent receptor-like protein [Tenacibaculum gallaicum]|uniref:TonB-dependent receptor-like protein n=1 Tax=Tenacibaculum gallaicum TaxID=561505 RepID=A0A3E0I7N7_9FLAO|nr:TonB-dependent receptor plug domain-containing protein [Tenacibaculum gallaicum]REH54631.1 TonB-dependent receptor-like protein [Tenacibaculum gallaicum]